MADSDPTDPPATAKQQKELRRLADRTGTAFTYPRDVGEASREIKRLKGLRSEHRGVARSDAREVSRVMAAPRAASDFQARETTGHGSSARWADDRGDTGEPVIDMRTGARYDVRIDRETKWGNDFVVGRDGSPEQVVELYKRQLWKNLESGKVSREELASLDGKTLGCWCAPGPCHGDVLVKASEWASRELGRTRAIEARSAAPSGLSRDSLASSSAAAVEPAGAAPDPKPLGGSRADHIAAALEKPGPHLTAALGSAPDSPTMRRGWERAVRAIERYRFENGVTGPEPLGPKPEGARQLRRFNAAGAELTRGRQVLGLDATPSVSPSLSIGL